MFSDFDKPLPKKPRGRPRKFTQQKQQQYQPQYYQNQKYKPPIITNSPHDQDYYDIQQRNEESKKHNPMYMGLPTERVYKFTKPHLYGNKTLFFTNQQIDRYKGNQKSIPHIEDALSKINTNYDKTYQIIKSSMDDVYLHYCKLVDILFLKMERINFTDFLMQLSRVVDIPYANLPQEIKQITNNKNNHDNDNVDDHIMFNQQNVEALFFIFFSQARGTKFKRHLYHLFGATYYQEMIFNLLTDDFIFIIENRVGKCVTIDYTSKLNLSNIQQDEKEMKPKNSRSNHRISQVPQTLNQIWNNLNNTSSNVDVLSTNNTSRSINRSNNTKTKHDRNDNINNNKGNNMTDAQIEEYKHSHGLKQCTTSNNGDPKKHDQNENNKTNKSEFDSDDDSDEDYDDEEENSDTNTNSNYKDKRDSSNDNVWFIIPICHGYPRMNHKDISMMVGDNRYVADTKISPMLILIKVKLRSKAKRFTMYMIDPNEDRSAGYRIGPRIIAFLLLCGFRSYKTKFLFMSVKVAKTEVNFMTMFIIWAWQRLIALDFFNGKKLPVGYDKICSCEPMQTGCVICYRKFIDKYLSFYGMTLLCAYREYAHLSNLDKDMHDYLATLDAFE